MPGGRGGRPGGMPGSFPGGMGGMPGGFPGGMGGMPGGMGGMPGGMGGMPGGMGGMPGGMGGMPAGMENIFSDPEVMEAMQDPEVRAPPPRHAACALPSALVSAGHGRHVGPEQARTAAGAQAQAGRVRAPRSARPGAGSVDSRLCRLFNKLKSQFGGGAQ
jgi:hypothetical protein